MAPSGGEAKYLTDRPRTVVFSLRCTQRNVRPSPNITSLNIGRKFGVAASEFCAALNLNYKSFGTDISHLPISAFVTVIWPKRR